MQVLVTGFEPFGGVEDNPSRMILDALPERLDDMELTKIELPVVFAEAGPQIAATVATLAPDVVLSLGLFSGTTCLTLERVAINLAEAFMPDNADEQPHNEPLVPGGPDGLFTTLPVHRMLEAIHSVGVPAQLSLSAGSYVCNQVMYMALHQARQMKPRPRVGFMHVPLTPELAVNRRNRASLALADMLRGIEAALRCL